MTQNDRPQALANVQAIEPYKPGKSSVPGVANPVKLASNENPFGPSPKALAAYREAAARLELYPDGSAPALRAAIGARYGLDPARIICGAGSDEIFLMLGRAYLGPGDEMIQSEHAFSIYAIIAAQSGGVVKTAKNKDYAAQVDTMLGLVSPRTKLVFLDNPNNPTGTYLPYDEVRRLHAGLPAHVLLVIDAAYAEFVRRNDYSPGIELVSENQNVIMTRTFSKIYGLAAARIGWAYGPPGVIEALNKVRMPFNVSTPAQAAAIAAIGDVDFAERSADHNARELARVTGALRALGLDVTESVGNFVLVHFPRKPGKGAAAADDFLSRRGFILRRVDGYGLPDALRLSIGKTEDNTGVIAALKDFLA
ncbi:MAG TPA: histidinol-phosphate transaminase [Caulobacterales bacterium]|jgi:histidinol-phosphate aminotransferase|nr:histidinol-phosphate transaminase [Caulobacterales bacterium]